MIHSKCCVASMSVSYACCGLTNNIFGSCDAGWWEWASSTQETKLFHGNRSTTIMSGVTSNKQCNHVGAGGPVRTNISICAWQIRYMRFRSIFYFNLCLISLVWLWICRFLVPSVGNCHLITVFRIYLVHSYQTRTLLAAVIIIGTIVLKSGYKSDHGQIKKRI